MHSDPKHCYYLSLSLTVKVIGKTHRKDNAPWSNKHAVQKKMSRDSPYYWCPTDVKYVMNDLLTITERGQKRSRVTRWILTTAQRFLASIN